MTARGRRGDRRSGEARRVREAGADRRSTRRRAPAQGDERDEDHGAADELHRPDRRGAAPAGAAAGARGRLLHGRDPAAVGLSRQSVPDRGRARLGRRAAGGRDVHALSLRQPGAAALPAVGLRHHQVGDRRSTGRTTSSRSRGARCRSGRRFCSSTSPPCGCRSPRRARRRSRTIRRS